MSSHQCTRIIEVSGKTGDLCDIWYKGKSRDGYVPDNLGIGSGDYLEFDVCAECGRIQDFNPLADEEIFAALGHDNDDNDDDESGNDQPR